MSFSPLYVPVGVPTFHMESARAQFEASKGLLAEIDDAFVFPEDMLLSVDTLSAYLEDKAPDAVLFQNLTFANAAYATEVARRFSVPVMVWTLREPVIDGGRLRLNSLTGAYSAANTFKAFSDREIAYVFGSPDEARVKEEIAAFVRAARLKKDMRDLTMAAVGHTPQGFGFGRALDAELTGIFGVRLVSIEVRELIARAKAMEEADAAPYLQMTEEAVTGFDKTPAENRRGHAMLLAAYMDFVKENGIGALASRCWPDLFTDYGTPVCTVLSMLNDRGVAASCEADIYGALSMWAGMQLSGGPTFFGDPVSLNEEENTITFWHCGAAACSLARTDTGAAVGVHPNRRIGPVMDFGCASFGGATVFRISRDRDGSFRFFIAEGETMDKPKQFEGTSVVVRMEGACRKIVEDSVKKGFEPHYVVIKGKWGKELTMLAEMFGLSVVRY